MGTQTTGPEAGTWLTLRRGEPDDDELAAVVLALLAVRDAPSSVRLRPRPAASPWTSSHRYLSPRSWTDV